MFHGFETSKLRGAQRGGVVEAKDWGLGIGIRRPHRSRPAQATVGQIRLKLFKIAARVKISCRRIHLELASAYPYRETYRQAWANLFRIACWLINRAKISRRKTWISLDLALSCLLPRKIDLGRLGGRRKSAQSFWRQPSAQKKRSRIVMFTRFL